MSTWASAQQPLAVPTPPISYDDGAVDDGIDPAGRRRRVIPQPPPLDRHGPARVMAICNQKGGVGKTTSTINLGAALAEYGRRVLLVDFDPQGALSVGLGVQPHQLDTTIYNLIMERNVGIDDVIRPTTVEGMDLLPSNIDLSAAEVQLVTEVGREQTLGRTINPVLDRLNPKLEITGILATMYDPRTLHTREVMTRVVEAFGELVFDAVINRT